MKQFKQAKLSWHQLKLHNLQMQLLGCFATVVMKHILDFHPLPEVFLFSWPFFYLFKMQCYLEEKSPNVLSS